MLDAVNDLGCNLSYNTSFILQMKSTILNHCYLQIDLDQFGQNDTGSVCS